MVVFFQLFLFTHEAYLVYDIRKLDDGAAQGGIMEMPQNLCPGFYLTYSSYL